MINRSDKGLKGSVLNQTYPPALYVCFLFSSSMRGQAGDIPPDGPVDLEELERNLPPLLPQVGYIYS